MKIKLSFKTWNEQYTYKYYKKRIWLGGFWTPLVKVYLRQGELNGL